MKDSDQKSIPARFHHHFFYSWGLFIALMVSNFIFWQIAKNNIRLQTLEKFHHQVSIIKVKVENQVEAYRSMLEAGASFFASSDFVGRAEFDQFYSNLVNKGFSISSGIEGIAYIESTDSQADFTARVRQDRFLDPDGLPNFSIFPNLPNDQFLIFNYLYPHDKNTSLFGYNLASDPNQLSVLNSITDRDSVVATGKTVLLNSPRIVLYHTLTSNQNKSLGYLAIILNPDTLFDSQSSQNQPHPYMEYKLIESDIEIYENSLGESPKEPEKEIYLESTEKLVLFGRNVDLKVRSPQREHISTFLFYLPDLIFVGGGILITVLFTLISSVVFYSHEHPDLKIRVNTLFGKAPPSPDL